MLNENYFIAQFTFFGFLILINFLFTKNDYRFLIGLVFSIIYFSFSYPPYTLPLAPSFHLATIFLVFKLFYLVLNILGWLFYLSFKFNNFFTRKL